MRNTEDYSYMNLEEINQCIDLLENAINTLDENDFGYQRRQEKIEDLVHWRNVKEAEKAQEKEIKHRFWENNPQFKNEYSIDKTQNDYSAEIRTEWNDYTYYLLECGEITDEMYNNIIL